MTPPKVLLKTPAMSDEGLSVSWNFNENASATCELHSPSMLNVTTIPCLENTVLIKHSLEGYSLFVQGTDNTGNVAESVRITWNIGKIVMHRIEI